MFLYDLKEPGSGKTSEPGSSSISHYLQQVLDAA